MSLVIASGMLTAIMIVATTVCAFVSPNPFWQLFAGVLTTKCYINAYLTSLNARDSLRRSGEAHFDLPLNSIEFRSTGRANQINVDIFERQFE